MKFERVSIQEALAYKIRNQDENKKMQTVLNDFLSEQIVASYKLVTSDDKKANDHSYVIFIITLPKRIEMTFVPRYGNDQKKLSVQLINPREKMLAWVDKQLENTPDDFYEEKDDLRGNVEFNFIGNEASWPFQDFLSLINKMPAFTGVAKAQVTFNKKNESNNDEEPSYGSYFGL